jgi:ABC-2 type transport system ATP-binding protein
MTGPTTAIKAQELTKKFGNFSAVDGVDFEVQTGEIFGFLGPNGSGKTTTIRMALGLLKPTAGSVKILDHDVDTKNKEIRPLVGYMSQRFSLYNDLTVLQNLNFYGAAYGLKNSLLEVRINEALKLAGLEGREKTKTKDLSGGWRQRLALSAAILHRPAVLFLDEPTAGVDPISRRVFWDLLYKLVTENITVFVTTHYMDEAEHCQRLAFIQHGKIIAYGSPTAIKREKMKGQVLEISPSNPATAIQVLKALQSSGSITIKEFELYGSKVHVIIKDPEQYRLAIEDALRNANIKLIEINLIEPSLEDVFIASMKA